MLLGKISADFQWTDSLIKEVLLALWYKQKPAWVFFFATIQQLNIHQVFFSGNETIIARRETRGSRQLIRQKEWADRRTFFLPLDQ